MANREELGIIKGARSGDAGSQLALGKLYLFGSAGLPKSIPTALHWLQRAAQQGCADAWLLIGAHVPIDIARQSVPAVIGWYEHAHDAGVAQASLVWAQLTLAGDSDGALRAKALAALEAAALAGLPDAQWLLAQQDGRAPAPLTAATAPDAAEAAPTELQWLTRAADSGVPEALYALIARAWDGSDWGQFLQRALPMARLLLRAHPDGGPAPLAPQEVQLLSRCAQALCHSEPTPDAAQAEMCQFWELAAHSGDRAAQLALGLWFARMDAQGGRVPAGGAVNFKRAIRWLTQAGEQGLAEAWFALSRIYVKPEFSQRSVREAQCYLERAADMGHSAAQLECGMHAWRTRRGGENNDVRAAYWLLKAAAQGSAEAEAALRKIAPGAAVPDWLPAASAARALDGGQPLLAARLELAGLFNLSRAEALLLDMNAADQGHCLVVDIRASYGRSKRRLVLLRTTRERRALDHITRLFDGVDCGPNGPEGNYRQRLYRLKTCFPDLEPDAPADDGLLPA